jgi:excisionase family DNA binding protein
MEEKTTLTTGEIASYCGVNFRTVIRWIKRGLMPSYTLPGRGDNRVRTADFVRFLQDNQMPIPGEFRCHTQRVLVVDDVPEMAKTIKRILRRYKYEVQIAESGFEAGSMLGTFAPAVMTLDLQMPGLSGFDVLKFVRNTPALSNVRVLVISAMPDEVLQEALDAGADDILSKPFDIKKLIEKVDQRSGRLSPSQ